MDSLVSTAWLAEHLDNPDLTVVDCSWHMPASGRDGHIEYTASHIPGARFLDIDQVRDHSNPAPHMLPPAEEFGSAMEMLGVGKDHRIIVYDNSPLRTAARGWFMLRHFGARKVAILDGGFQKWVAEGRPTASGDQDPTVASFEAAENRDDISSKSDLLAHPTAPVVDARSRPRFEGSEADPRAGVLPGHIPGARNIPFAAVYNDDGTFRTRDELKALFEGEGISVDRPFIASCGSGVTANSLIFAAHLLGNNDTRLYDGSWSEWGADPTTPKATGPS